MAKIVPLAEPLTAASEKLPVATAFGSMKGQIWIADDAFYPLTEDELALWEDGPIEPAA